MEKNCVMDVLDKIVGIPGVSDGKHRIVICGGRSKNWWDHSWDAVTAVKITNTRIKLYI